jgi:hypothetical protein
MSQNVRPDAFKTVMTASQMLDLPMFIKARKEKFEIRKKGQETQHCEQKNLKRLNSMRKDKPQRKLVIVQNKTSRQHTAGDLVSPSNGSRTSKAIATTSLQMGSLLKNDFMNTYVVD